MSEPASLERRPSVLVVEDEPMISDVAVEVLAEQGFEVRAVDNARDALRCLEAGPPIDVLFTDVNLPGAMDGAALARRARELRPDLSLQDRAHGAGGGLDVCRQTLRPVPHRRAARLHRGGKKDHGAA